MKQVAICDYGAGNTASVVCAFQRLGARTVVTNDAALVGGADLAVLPGVGSARTAMSSLRTYGLDDALRDRVDAERPVLGICLGLQLALEWSEEDGGVECLSIVPGRVQRLRADRIPRIGWATVEPWNEVYYFAHSYAASTAAVIGISDEIAAAVRKGSFLGVQFHPEKSGAAGSEFLRQCLFRD